MTQLSAVATANEADGDDKFDIQVTKWLSNWNSFFPTKGFQTLKS